MGAPACVPFERYVAPGDSDLIATLRAENERLRRDLRMLRIANKELERIVDRDTLTPLYNRRYFINAINEKLRRLERYGATAILVFADVDGLKAINDTHGHAAGDYALIHVATRLIENVRATDVVARIGGDEFGLILDEMTEEEALQKIALLSAVLRETVCAFNGVTLDVSASFGLSALKGDDTEESVMRRADSAMYSGRRGRG